MTIAIMQGGMSMTGSPSSDVYCRALPVRRGEVGVIVLVVMITVVAAILGAVSARAEKSDRRSMTRAEVSGPLKMYGPDGRDSGLVKYVVAQQGETYWNIVPELRAGYDRRDWVQAISILNGWDGRGRSPLQPGDVVAVPDWRGGKWMPELLARQIRP